MTIEEYVSKDEYLTRYERRTEYKGYTVYEAWRSEDEGACIGYPCYLFVAGDTVRSATLEEIEQVMDLLCTDATERMEGACMTDVNDFYFRVLDKTHLDNILDFEKLCFGTDCWKKEDWIDLLQDDRAVYYALMNKDDIVANLFVYNWQGEKDYLKIMNIAVHPAYRKQGLARILLDKAHDLMVNAKLHRICGETRKSNIPMQKAFESSGYELSKIEPQCYSNPNEDGYKYVFMETNKITNSI